MNIPLLFGSLLGFLSVMMAAYVDHSLSLSLVGKSLSSVLTAVKYQQLYAILICMLSLILPLQTNSKSKRWIKRALYFFLIGVTFFITGIYFSFLFNLTKIIYLAPLGGILLMLGWCCLICSAVASSKINVR